MTLVLHEHQAVARASLAPWFRRLYDLVIEARQRQADMRVAAYLRDLPNDVIRKVGVSVDAIEALGARAQANNLSHARKART